MTRHDSRRGASNLGIPLMLVAFALMGGLIYWLAITAEPTEIVVVEEEAPEDQFIGIELDAAVLESPQITGYEGELVRVADLPFAQQVGPAQFFANLPQGSPFLIRMGDQLRADSVAMPTSGNITVTGRLHALTDSIRDAWQAEGTVDGGSRPLVDFAAHYIDATQIRTDASADDAESDTSGAGESGGDGA